MECKEIIIPNVKPKYEIGQKVYRLLYGGTLVEPNTIRKIDYRHWGGETSVVYYFPRERTPFQENLIYATEEEAHIAVLKIETKNFKNRFLAEVEHLRHLGMAEQEIAKQLGCNDIKLLGI